VLMVRPFGARYRDLHHSASIAKVSMTAPPVGRLEPPPGDEVFARTGLGCI